MAPMRGRRPSGPRGTGPTAGLSELLASVMPFPLRGVNLLGINSVTVPYAHWVAIWDRLARDLDLGLLEGMIRPAVLADVPALGAAILRGQVQGRVVVNVNG